MLLDDRRLDALGRLVEQERAWARRTGSGRGPGAAARRRESAPPGRSSSGVELGELGQHARRPSPCGLPAATAAMRRLSRTVRPGKISPPLRHVAEAAPGARVRRRAGDVRAVEDGSRRAVAGSRPISVLSSVVLPMPLWPRMPTQLAAGDLERDAVQDADAAVAGVQVLARLSSASAGTRAVLCRDRRRAPSGSCITRSTVVLDQDARPGGGR